MIGSVFGYVLVMLVPLFFSIKEEPLIECDLIHLVKVRYIFKMITAQLHVGKIQFGYAIKMILAHAAVTLTITFALYARIFVEAWRLLKLDAGLHHHGHHDK